MNNTQSAQIIRAGSVSNSSQSSGSGSTFSRSPSGPRRTVADTGLGTFFQHPFGMYMCLKRETGRDACSPFHVDAQNILTCLHTHDATFPPTEPLPHTGYNGKTWRKSGTGVEASPSAVHSILAPSCLNRTSSLPHHVLRTVNARPLHASTLMAQNNSQVLGHSAHTLRAPFDTAHGGIGEGTRRISFATAATAAGIQSLGPGTAEPPMEAAHLWAAPAARHALFGDDIPKTQTNRR
jgi:hypothetical protein